MGGFWRVAFAALVFCALLAGPASAQGRSDLFSVAGVRVDATAATAAEARARAVADAQRQAYVRLVRRLAPSQEIAARPPLDPPPEILDRLVAGIDIEEERRSATRYIARLAINFNPSTTRQYLQSQGYSLIEQRTSPVLVVAQLAGAAPAAQDQWRQAWASGGFEQELAPIIVASGAVSGPPSWEAAAAEAAQVGAVSAVFATARIVSGGVVAELVEVSPGAPPRPRGQASAPLTIGEQGFTPSLSRLAASINDQLQADWKTRLVAEPPRRTRVTAQALYARADDWRRIKSAIAAATASIVSEVRIEAVAKQGALLSFTYSGAPEQLAAELGRNGVRVAPAGVTGAELTLSLVDG